MTDTANLGLPFIEGAQAQKHVTHNEALKILDAAIQIAVLDRNRTAPPPGAANGQRHVVAAGASGAWAARDNAVATWQDGAWSFLSPRAGWCIWSVADDAMLVFDGSAWRDLRNLALDNVAHLGVNTTADSTNRLSVKSNAALLAAVTAAGGGSGDIRLQLSKESAAKTASLVFADNYSGRAEFGLVGSDAFRLKVSADGSTWLDALVIDPATGNLTLPRALALSATIAPPQITANQNNYNPAGLSASSVLRLSSDAVRNLTGLTGGADGRLIVLRNAGSYDIVLKSESASSSAANRFAIGPDRVVRPGLSEILLYDVVLSRWVAVGAVHPNPKELVVGGSAGIVGGTGSKPALQVQGSTSSDTQYGFDSGSIGVYRYTATDGISENGIGGPNIVLNKSRSDALGTAGAVTVGDELGRLRFSGNDGTNFVEGAALTARCTTNATANIVPGQLEIYTHNAAGVKTLGLAQDSNQRVIISSPTLTASVPPTLSQSTNIAGEPRLQVHGLSFDDSGAGLFRWQAGLGGASLSLLHSRGATVGGHVAVAANDQLGVLRFLGSDGANFSQGGQIKVVAQSTPSAGVIPGKMSFATANTSGSQVDALTIDQAQAVVATVSSASPTFLANGAPATAAHLDCSGMTAITLANGANVPIAPAGGGFYLLAITEVAVTAGVGLYLMGGGAVYFLGGQWWTTSTTTPVAGYLSVAYANGQYRAYNNQGNGCSLKACLVKIG